MKTSGEKWQETPEIDLGGNQRRETTAKCGKNRELILIISMY